MNKFANFYSFKVHKNEHFFCSYFEIFFFLAMLKYYVFVTFFLAFAIIVLGTIFLRSLNTTGNRKKMFFY